MYTGYSSSYTSNSNIDTIRHHSHAKRGITILSSLITYLPSRACFTKTIHTTEKKTKTKTGITRKYGINTNTTLQIKQMKNTIHRPRDCCKWNISYILTSCLDKAATIQTKKYIKRAFFLSTLLGTYPSSINQSRSLDHFTMRQNKKKT